MTSGSAQDRKPRSGQTVELRQVTAERGEKVEIEILFFFPLSISIDFLLERNSGEFFTFFLSLRKANLEDHDHGQGDLRVPAGETGTRTKGEKEAKQQARTKKRKRKKRKSRM